MRSLQNQSKIEPLKLAFGAEAFDKRVELVEADLMNKDALVNAIQGCSYVIHVANPLPGVTKISDEEFLRPAVEGMQSILDGCVRYGVKKLIVTSSLAAMVGGVWKKDTGDNHYSEKDFAPPDGADAYGRSKIA